MGLEIVVVRGLSRLWGVAPEEQYAGRRAGQRRQQGGDLQPKKTQADLKE